MKVLVCCEFSGRVREAFRRRGHDAWSCDLLPAEDGGGNHYRVDAFQAIGWDDWDLVIAHPPCTYLARCGARWWPQRQAEQRAAVEFFLRLASVPNDGIRGSARCWAIENPIGCMSRIYRKPDQVVQPWQYGHPETKATCLWLSGLPPLKPTKDVRAEMLALAPHQRHRIHYMPPSKDRQRERSRTYQGIADAMAEQWGSLCAP